MGLIGLVMGCSIYAGVWAVDSNKSMETQLIAKGIAIGVGIMALVLGVYFDFD